MESTLTPPRDMSAQAGLDDNEQMEQRVNERVDDCDHARAREPMGFFI